MAKERPTYNQTDIGVAINRSNGQPLDSTELWYDLTSLENYVKSGQAYVGQRLTYITATGDVRHYTIIDTDGNLRMDAIYSYDEETLTLDIYTADISVE